MRRQDTYNEFEGLVRSDFPLLPPERELSPTSIEDYAVCGFRFFMKSVLRVQAPDEPEEVQTMDPAMRGTLVHRVLQRFFAAQQGRGRPQRVEAWDATDEGELLSLLEEELGIARARGRVGLPIFHAHEVANLRADLSRFLHEDSAMRAGLGARPEAFEWRFNGVEIAGRRFRGSADRIDRSLDGSRAWVIDYKTGRAESYRDKPGDPFHGGQQLQLGIYAAALTASEPLSVTGRYWFITQRGEFESVEYEHSPGNAARLERVVTSIADGIAAGVFPAVPGDDDWRGGFTNCQYCDFDRVCSRRRVADFTNRAGDAALQPWTDVGLAALDMGDA
jgi:RecB family exonuclease